MCAPPQLTLVMCDFSGSCQTYFTTRVQPELLSSFCYLPSCPQRPRPTMSNFPASVKRAVWAPPQLIDFILVFKLPILRGRNWSDLSPCPNCPQFPKPQVQTSPSFVTMPEQLSPQEISTTFSLESTSKRTGSFAPLSPPVPNWPQVLFPQTQTLPQSLRAMLKLIPEATFTIFLRFSSTSQFLLLAWPFTPLKLVSPRTKTLPSALTKVIQSFAQEAWRTFCRSILVGAFVISFLQDQLVPMLLNLSFLCYNPHTYASPRAVTTHMCWQPQLTWVILSWNYTSRGTRTFKFAGSCPKIPFLFFPQVRSLPSLVMPAERVFLQSMSTKFTFLISCGSEMLDYDPMPSSPFLPKPQAQAQPYFCWELKKEVGRKTAAPSAKDTINLRFII